VVGGGARGARFVGLESKLVPLFRRMATEEDQSTIPLSPMEHFKTAERAKLETDRQWRLSQEYKVFLAASAERKKERGEALRAWELEWKTAYRTGFLVARHVYEGVPLEPHKFRTEIETAEESARMEALWKRHLLTAGSRVWIEEVKAEMRAKDAWLAAGGGRGGEGVL
jgi:hypothetical protein